MNGLASSSVRENAIPKSKPLKKAPELVPMDANNWLIHARYMRKEFEICKLIIEEDLRKNKGCNEYAIYVLGLILRHEGKVRESLECFQKCLFLNPSNVKNIKQLGKSWVLLGRLHQAIEAFEEAEAISKSPDWNIHHNLGECYAAVGQRGKAREYLRKAVHQGRTEKSYQALAELHVLENDINSALEIYDIALELFPSSSDLATAQGLLYIKVGDFQKAFNKLGTSLAFRFSDSQSLLGVASICEKHEEYDIALSKFKIAGQCIPESVTLWNNMGLCFLGKGKSVAAISCLKRANYLDPMDWQILYNLGLIHTHCKQYASAFHFLSGAIKLENKHVSSFMLLGIVLQKLGDNENAMKCFQQGIKVDPDDLNIRINYSSFLYTIGKREMALEELNITQRITQQNGEENHIFYAIKKLTHLLTKEIIPSAQESEETQNSNSNFEEEKNISL